MSRRQNQEGRRTLWTKEQDEAIVKLVRAHGTKKWTVIAKHLGDIYNISGRSGKQIRERWNNHLNPDIKKGPITLQEGVKIFKFHHDLGNKWADITTHLPGRTDNTVKNYFYATVRRHLRKINKCLRNNKFCEIFNIQAKQIQLKFLVDALDSGDLDYYQIRKIENKELMGLSKKKSGITVSKISGNEKQMLNNLDGRGKPLDKNLELFKNMLQLIEVDLSDEAAEDHSEEQKSDNDNDLQSISFKNAKIDTVDQEILDKHTSQDRRCSARLRNCKYKRPKNSEFESFQDEVKEEENDVNFIEIPTVAKPKKVDMLDKATR